MKHRQSLYSFVALFVSLLVFGAPDARAQGQERLVMFTGIVTAGKTSEPLPGAYVYIPKAGRGVLSNSIGYFALPVMPGDSIIFSYVGFTKQYHIVPRRLPETSYSAVIAMQEDVTVLKEVKVYPYATEELFKQALVNMELPDAKERAALERNLSPESMQRLAALTPMSAAANYRYFQNQQWFGRDAIANRGSMTMLPFLNPSSWMQFIRSVKNGDFKSKEFRKELNATPPENLKREDIIRRNN